MDLFEMEKLTPERRHRTDEISICCIESVIIFIMDIGVKSKFDWFNVINKFLSILQHWVTGSARAELEEDTHALGVLRIRKIITNCASCYRRL